MSKDSMWCFWKKTFWELNGANIRHKLSTYRQTKLSNLYYLLACYFCALWSWKEHHASCHAWFPDDFSVWPVRNKQYGASFSSNFPSRNNDARLASVPGAFQSQYNMHDVFFFVSLLCLLIDPDQAARRYIASWEGSICTVHIRANCGLVDCAWF